MSRDEFDQRIGEIIQELAWVPCDICGTTTQQQFQICEGCAREIDEKAEAKNEKPE